MARIPLMARGRRNRFFEAEGVDDLMTMVLELTAEVSVLRERQYVLERVLEDNDLAVGKSIEAWRPNAEDEAVLSEDRERLISTVLRTLDVESKGPGAVAKNQVSRPRQHEMEEDLMPVRAGTNG